MHNNVVSLAERRRFRERGRFDAWAEMPHALEELFAAMDELRAAPHTPEVANAYEAVYEAARTLIAREQRLEQWAK